jgi:hypothetical protein
MRCGRPPFGGHRWLVAAADLLMPIGFGITAGYRLLYPVDWAPATGPPAVRQRRGSAEGSRPSASRGANPPTWRGGAGGCLATKTQELRPSLSVNTQPNHVLPLAHFGAISDVYDGGVVRTDRHSAGERSGSTKHYDLRPEGSPCICWWLVKPITGQAPSTAATLE